MKGSMQVKLQGFAPANRDAVVRLKNESTGAVVERKPFLDGTLLVRDLEPGMYELEVVHPNVIEAIERRRVRIFGQKSATLVPVVVRPDWFDESKLPDVPDKKVGPIQQTATAVRESLAAIGGKSAGEAIRAADWNALVAGVSDLAGAILELTYILAPRGHTHPDLGDRVDGIREDMRRSGESFGRSVILLRREVEAVTLRRDVTAMLDAGNASAEVRDRALARVSELEGSLMTDTQVFTGKLARTGTVLLDVVNVLAVAAGAGGDAFLAKPEVKAVAEVSRGYVETGAVVRPEAEMATYEASARATGGRKLTRIVGG